MENWRYFNIIFGSCVDFYNAQGSSWLPHDELDFGEWQKNLGGLQIEPFKELIQKRLITYIFKDEKHKNM